MFLQRMPGAPPLSDITGKELVYVLPVLSDLTPGPNLASVTVNQLGAFVGGGGSIPNNSVLGNISGAPGSPTALTPSQLTSLMTLFSATQSGAVPAPGAAPLNAVLQADGSWQVPAGPAGPTGAFQYNDGGVWGGSARFQLLGNTVTFDSDFRVSGNMRSDGWMQAAGTLNNIFINSNQIRFVESGAGIIWPYDYLSAFLVCTDDFGGSTQQYAIEVLRRGSQFRIPQRDAANLLPASLPPGVDLRGAIATVSNAIDSVGPVQAGGTNIVPVFCNGTDWRRIAIGPPAGTVTNAALQADMTWKVPGTNYVNINSDYTILPTDDVIRLNGATSPRILTLPDISNVPMGKKITVIISNTNNTAGTVTFLASGSDNIYVLASVGFLPIGVPNASYTLNVPSDGNNSQAWYVELTRAANWFLINQGPPISGTLADTSSVGLPGLLPGPPAGTATNAALHADMTWKVPGTQLRTAMADYNVPPFVDTVRVNQPNLTITLPSAVTVPGKTYRLFRDNTTIGETTTIVPPPGVYAFTRRANATMGWVLLPSIQLITIDAGYDIDMLSMDGIWFLTSRGPAVRLISSGTVYYLPGLTTGSRITNNIYYDFQAHAENDIINIVDSVLITGSFTVTLPDVGLIQNGKVLKIIGSLETQFSPGLTFTIASGTGGTMRVMSPNGWALSNNIVMTSPWNPTNSIFLTFTRSDGLWYVTNEGLQTANTVPAIAGHP